MLIEAGKISNLNPHEQRNKNIKEHWFPFLYKALSRITLFQSTQNYTNEEYDTLSQSYSMAGFWLG